MYMYSEYQSAFKKEVLQKKKKRNRKKEVLTFASTWLNLEDIVLSETSQKEEYCMISLMCRI